ncbi:MAG: NAD-dependent epimerase/dehydratase family protein [Planctomycetes bacterium]|nr:NAD-dependent epimerase/dehydratase family protein [Planctomycetota bacterium]
MRILVLGGTSFLGPHLVDAARRRGHEVTLFNRGRTNAHLFPELEKIHGDRNVAADLAPLAERDWDVVFDHCGYFPDQVEATAGLLAKHAGLYAFVSSLSVFREASGQDEAAAVAEISDEECMRAIESRRITGENYGPLKARCEAAAEAAMPGRAANVRPGLIVGPGDPSQRFTYWPARIADGGEILSPGDPDVTTQFLDVRDLAEWLVRIAEAKSAGVFHAVGFAGPVTIEEVLHGCKIVTGSDCAFTWVDDEFLQRHEVRPYMGPNSLPLWIPGERGSYSNEKARRNGLTFRPIGDTIEDTLAWHREQPAAPWRRAGMEREREAAVLAAWHDARK